MRTKSAPTMKDVAAEAGVALGTVSKVFNGLPVGETYRKKVEEAASKLGYRINNYARGMRTNKTNAIAVIMPELNHPFFALLSEELCRELAKRGYNAILAITDRDPGIEARCINMVRQQKADGIIALTYNSPLEEISDIPIVSIDRAFNGRLSCITSDNFEGGMLAAQKLSELGCKNLLFLRTGSSVPGETNKRGAGFENYCQTHQITYKAMRVSDQTLEEAIYPFLDECLKEGSFPYDGIFCSTDHLAFNTAERLRKNGVRVPEDVQIIGFDGLNDFWKGSPPVSSIVQNVALLAKTAVTTLLSLTPESEHTLTCLPVRYQAGPTTKDYYGK